MSWITLPSGRCINLGQAIECKWDEAEPMTKLHICYGTDPHDWLTLTGDDAELVANYMHDIDVYLGSENES